MSVDGYSDYQTLRLSRAGDVLEVAIDGDGPLNLIEGVLHRELSEIWSEIRLDEGRTRAVVFTGDGDRAFSAGGQARWFQSMTTADKDVAFAEARRTIVDMLEVPQPIVAAVNGPAVGLGATLALFSDVVVASERAVFADPHVVLGMVAGDGGAIIWPHLCGVNRAKELLLTGERVDAARAERIGLANHCVPHADVKAFAHALAARIAKQPQQAVRGTKIAINALLRDSVNMVLDTSLALERHTFDSAEHRDAIAAFIEQAETARAAR